MARHEKTKKRTASEAIGDERNGKETKRRRSDKQIIPISTLEAMSGEPSKKEKKRHRSEKHASEKHASKTHNSGEHDSEKHVKEVKKAQSDDAESPASEAMSEESDDETMRHRSEKHTTSVKKTQSDDSASGDMADEEEVDEEEAEEDEYRAKLIDVRQKKPPAGYEDMYLDQINRDRLDFDFEKLCSVTMSNLNVYACLICGKYYQGRGLKSPAYTHALDKAHPVFINLDNRKVFVLPEGYEVHNSSLDDIRFQVDPYLPKEEVVKLARDPATYRDISDKTYVPGLLGLNNIKQNDYLNVDCLALSHVRMLREYLMLADLSDKSQLAQRFSRLVRKLWSTQAFRTHVSPHELLQEVALVSKQYFTGIKQSDPADFMVWFMNELSKGLGGKGSIIEKCFQGHIKIEAQDINSRSTLATDRLRFEESDIASTQKTFLMLPLDLPSSPLFQNEMDATSIPQVTLAKLLSKFDGRTPSERANKRMRHRLLHPLPPYLLIHVRRFSKNAFVSERNSYIVTFDPIGLNMAPYAEPNPAIHPPSEPVLYDLIANVTHEAVRLRDDALDTDSLRKVWRVHLSDRPRGDWFELQDLLIDKVPGETLFTRESYLQIWERRPPGSS